MILKTMSQHELTMKIIVSRWEVDLLLIDESGEIIESNKTVFSKPASTDGIKRFMGQEVYRIADTLRAALYIWDDADERVADKENDDSTDKEVTYEKI